jgi:integrase
VEFYNHEIKEQFLNDIYENEDTKEAVSYIFKYSKGNEEVLGKDLFDFTIEEMGLVIANSTNLPRSVFVATTRGRYISRYITWAIKNNYRRSNINPFQGLDASFYSKFVEQDIKQYITKNDVEEFTAHLVNHQDIAILHMIFNGIYGHSSSEIRNLKMSDINRDEKSIRLYDDKKGERYICNVDEKLIDILGKANDDTIYQSSNGQGERQKESELVQNEFIIRPARRGRVVEHNPASQITIINRIKMIAEEFDMEDLTPKSIQRSGMIYMAYKLLKENNRTELTKQDYEKIGDHFNLSKITSNDGKYSYHNKTTMSEYINTDNIKKLYPDF